MNEISTHEKITLMTLGYHDDHKLFGIMQYLDVLAELEYKYAQVLMDSDKETLKKEIDTEYDRLFLVVAHEHKQKIESLVHERAQSLDIGQLQDRVRIRRDLEETLSSIQLCVREVLFLLSYSISNRYAAEHLYEAVELGVPWLASVQSKGIALGEFSHQETRENLWGFAAESTYEVRDEEIEQATFVPVFFTEILGVYKHLKTKFSQMSDDDPTRAFFECSLSTLRSLLLYYFYLAKRHDIIESERNIDK